jgi:hypothetical protein
LSQADTLALIRGVAERTKGNPLDFPLKLEIQSANDRGLAMAIRSPVAVKKLAGPGQCFTAEAGTGDDSRTSVRVGGLEQYKTNQSAFLGFIPIGPKRISGYRTYSHFLDEVAAELRRADPSASVAVSMPTA